MRDAAGNIIGTQYAASPFADTLGSSAAREASAAASSSQWDKILGGDFVDAFTGQGTLFGDLPTGQAPGYVPITPTSPVAPGLQSNFVEGPTRLNNLFRAKDIAGPAYDVSSVTLSPNAAAIQRGMEGARAAGMPLTSYQVAGPEGYAPNVAAARPGAPLSYQSPQFSTPPANLSVPAAAPSPALDIGRKLDALSPKGVFRATQGPSTVLGYDIGKAVDYTPFAPSYTASDVLKEAGMTSEKALKIGEAGMKTLTAKAADIAEKASPGIAQKYGPALALGAGAAALGGAFDPEEVPQPTREDLNLVADLGPTGYELFQEDPEKYKMAQLSPTQFVPSGTPLIPTTFPALQASEGGMAEFPRRQMLVEGPGTETSDDIPAMLSDGEFVMNARSVRGADPSGNGDRYAGAKNLYDMMRNFEMRA